MLASEFIKKIQDEITRDGDKVIRVGTITGELELVNDVGIFSSIEEIHVLINEGII